MLNVECSPHVSPGLGLHVLRELEELRVELQPGLLRDGEVDLEAHGHRAGIFLVADELDHDALLDELVHLRNDEDAGVADDGHGLGEQVCLCRVDEEHLAAGNVRRRPALANLELPALDGFAFDDVDVVAEGIGAEDADDEGRIVAGEGFLGPLGELGKVEKVERLVLIGRVGTALGGGAKGGEGKTEEQEEELQVEG